MDPTTNATDCANVFYYDGFYYDNTVADAIDYDEIITLGEPVSWDSEDGICKIASGEQVYGIDALNGGSFYELSQEFCSGYATIDSDGTVMLVFSELGSGRMVNIVTDAEDRSYRYTGSDYEIAEAYQETYSNIYGEMIKEYCNDEENSNFTTCYGSFYFTLAYDTNNVQYQSISEALSQAVSDGYLTKDNVKNYVCFGSDADICPNDNLYRIIGVFDGQVKLIKADYAISTLLGTSVDYYGAYPWGYSLYKGNLDASTITGYRWNYDTSVSEYGSNNWSTSELNTINLNNNYWNYLGTTWQNLIAETTWNLGGVSSAYSTIREFYEGERNNAGYGSNPTTYIDEIGLMYASDYGYAASPDAWTRGLIMYDKDVIAKDWLHMGLIEWTLSSDLLNNYIVFSMGTGGNIRSHARNGNTVRPVFYLNSNVELAGGTGTSTDPYRLVV